MPKVIKEEKIFGAVMQVVSERGYTSATTKQMAELAEVSEMTLFRKYASKAELVRQAIAFIAKQTAFASAARYTGDVHADLLKVAQAYQGTAEKHGLFILALFSEFERHPELAHSIEQPLNIFMSIVQMMAHYQLDGVF
jgi:AcrR family transcriptional regulator